MNTDPAAQLVRGFEQFLRAIVRDEFEKCIQHQAAHSIQPLAPAAPAARGSLTRKETAAYLGVCEKMVYLLAEQGEICRTAYAKYPVEALNEHLRQESERWRRKKKVTT